jgi:deoxyribodipyrimidine photo-lyase
MNNARLVILKEGIVKAGPVVYWMQRDQRVHDNWALIYAQNAALERSAELYVVFNLVTDFLEAAKRQYDFMLEGLKEVEKELNKYNIHFKILFGNSVKEIPKLLDEIDASLLVADFNPLKNVMKWKQDVSQNIQIPFHEIDAHNIVSYHAASSKLEFAAYTIRPKIERLLPEFLTDIPSPVKMPKSKITLPGTDWQKTYSILKIDNSISAVDWIKPGEKAAAKALKDFISKKFPDYGSLRNDPNAQMTSQLSPYLHFGQISAHRVALIIQPLIENAESHKSFLEELIVRRELSDNFCYYNKNYDSFEGFADWAKATLNKHRKDKRQFVYTLKQFENSETHDELWNAAQNEMVNSGKMHGYLRMYWAKKILEWSASPEEAMQTAILLNNKYELDGRDPNGYAGIAWSIGGVHDRAWFEREIFGKIRYMNFNGCARKFDVKKYIANWSLIA